MPTENETETHGVVISYLVKCRLCASVFVITVADGDHRIRSLHYIICY
jgi:hypothetical protein